MKTYAGIEAMYKELINGDLYNSVPFCRARVTADRQYCKQIESLVDAKTYLQSGAIMTQVSSGWELTGLVLGLRLSGLLQEEKEGAA